MIVDMHAHVFTAEALAKVDTKYRMFAPQLHVEAGKHVIFTGDRSSSSPYMLGFSDVKERLTKMDEKQVDIQVVSVTPGNFCYDSPVDAGLAISSAQNNAIAAMVEAHPDRFVGCATVPLQDPEVAAIELERCVKDLGFTAVEIGTNVSGKNLDSRDLDPFYIEANKLKIPIIVHPVNNAGADRMRNYYLGNIVGNPAETTIAIGSVVFGGVLDMFRNLVFCWSHGGGFWPYQFGRFDHGYEVRTEPKLNISKPPSKYASRMYYDTITHSETALHYLVSSMGAGYVLYGTDFPWDMGDYDSIPMIEGLKGVAIADRKRILCGTSAELFGIKL